MRKKVYLLVCCLCILIFVVLLTSFTLNYKKAILHNNTSELIEKKYNSSLVLSTLTNQYNNNLITLNEYTKLTINSTDAAKKVIIDSRFFNTGLDISSENEVIVTSNEVHLIINGIEVTVFPKKIATFHKNDGGKIINFPYDSILFNPYLFAQQNKLDILSYDPQILFNSLQDIKTIETVTRELPYNLTMASSYNAIQNTCYDNNPILDNYATLINLAPSNCVNAIVTNNKIVSSSGIISCSGNIESKNFKFPSSIQVNLNFRENEYDKFGDFDFENNKVTKTYSTELKNFALAANYIFKDSIKPSCLFALNTGNFLSVDNELVVINNIKINYQQTITYKSIYILK